MATKPTARKVPKTLAACADTLYSTRQERLELKRGVDALEAYEKAIKEHLIQTLPKGQATGTRGKLASVYVENKEIPQIKDPAKFWKWFGSQLTKNPDVVGMLSVKLLEGAVAEYQSANKSKLPPGVEFFTTPVVRMNKV